MNFTGLDFISGPDSLGGPGVSGNLTEIVIKNGTFDALYLSKNTEDHGLPIEDMHWDDSVIIYSSFDRTLAGGNTSDYVESIAALRLKKREVGSSDWVGIVEKTVDPASPTMEFAFTDHYARGNGTKYEYAIVPVSADGTEMDYVTVQVVNKLDGAVIADQNKMYHILLEPSVINSVKNRQATVVTTLNNKYPFVFFGGQADYFSGSFSGVAIPFNEKSREFDLAVAVAYRNELAEWLTNGEPKVLKLFDGRAWMIAVNGNVNLDCPDHPDKVTISFDFVEIGDLQSEDDLYTNGLSEYGGSIYGEQVSL